MVWQSDLLDCLALALRIQDLEGRRQYSDNPGEFTTDNYRLKKIREEAIVSTTYRLMTENGYLRNQVANQPYIGAERRYHDVADGQNVPRCDLLIKEFGQGQQFNYVEVKGFSEWNIVRNDQLRQDTRKLHNHGGRRGKYCLLYRIKSENEWDLWRLGITQEAGFVEQGRRDFSISYNDEVTQAQILLLKSRRPL